MRVVWNTCDKELGGEIKAACENYSKNSLQNLQKSLPFIGTYVKCLEKNCISGIVYVT